MDPRQEPDSQWGTFGRYCRYSGRAFTHTLIGAGRIAGRTARFVWYVSTDPDIRQAFRVIMLNHRPPPRVTVTETAPPPVRNFHEAENAYKRVRRNLVGAYPTTPESASEAEDDDQQRRRKVPQMNQLPSQQTPDIQGARQILETGILPARPSQARNDALLDGLHQRTQELEAARPVPFQVPAHTVWDTDLNGNNNNNHNNHNNHNHNETIITQQHQEAQPTSSGSPQPPSVVYTPLPPNRVFRVPSETPSSASTDASQATHGAGTRQPTGTTFRVPEETPSTASSKETMSPWLRRALDRSTATRRDVAKHMSDPKVREAIARHQAYEDCRPRPGTPQYLKTAMERYSASDPTSREIAKMQATASKNADQSASEPTAQVTPQQPKGTTFRTPYSTPSTLSTEESPVSTYKVPLSAPSTGDIPHTPNSKDSKKSKHHVCTCQECGNQWEKKPPTPHIETRVDKRTDPRTDPRVEKHLEQRAEHRNKYRAKQRAKQRTKQRNEQPSPLDYRSTKEHVATPFPQGRLERYCKPESSTGDNKPEFTSSKASASRRKVVPAPVKQDAPSTRQKLQAQAQAQAQTRQTAYKNKAAAAQVNLDDGKQQALQESSPKASDAVSKRKLSGQDAPFVPPDNEHEHARKSRSPPHDVVFPKGNSEFTQDAAGYQFRFTAPVSHAESSSQGSKGILRRPESTSFNINFTTTESKTKPTISLDDAKEDQVMDLGFLPDAPSPAVKKTANMYPMYEFGAPNPIPKIFDQDQPVVAQIDYPADYVSVEERFTKPQDRAMIDTPEKSELDEDSVMLPSPPNYTPPKKDIEKFRYPNLFKAMLQAFKKSTKPSKSLAKPPLTSPPKAPLTSPPKAPLTSPPKPSSKAQDEETKESPVRAFDKPEDIVNFDLDEEDDDEKDLLEAIRLEEEEKDRLAMELDRMVEFGDQEAEHRAAQFTFDFESLQHYHQQELNDAAIIESANKAKAEAKRSEEEEVQAGIKAEERARGKQPAAKFAIQDLNEETERELQSIMFDFECRDPKDTTFIHKTVRDDSTITYRELETIFGQLGWLNDEVVNEFLGACMSLRLKNDGYEKSNPSQCPPVHAFNSAMWTTYQAKGAGALLRWFKRAKLLGAALMEAQCVFIPINTGGHWVLLVLFGQDQQFVVLDSMAGMPPRIKSQYVEFAHDLIQACLGSEYKREDWVQGPLYSSQQHNGSDCGVFVCLNALALTRGLDPAKAVVGGHREMQLARQMIAGVLVRGSLEAAGVGF